jgi:L-2,4-diaminobutyrate decarboxylase
MGPDTIGALFDQVINRAHETRALLAADPRFEVAGRSDLSTVVFRYLPTGRHKALADAANVHAREALLASGEAVIAGTKVDGFAYLKFTVLNPATTGADIEDVVELVAAHAADLISQISRFGTPVVTERASS